eukprot:CAMPEP_0184673698 /NCGR_PEP_ID=MMETSP0308-20130426/86823_1 /TAXON_ID=38269 /ORGANISM="Gloeochaete witrockiana, Strain SAG 46.84" /LENGTH=369 /DNA_ID=CAMNT_0027121213 /DNA_START=214 /DNA_END=1323 /DNA_ORIENTATION=-
MVNLYYCSTVILVFLVLPTSMTALTGFFGCLDLGGNRQFLLRDLSLDCQSAEYNAWSLAFALPLLILYGVVIPGLGALVLYRGRDQLNSIEFARRYGFLYMGYRRELYMYEAFVAIRKNLLAVVLAVFVASPHTQGLCAMGIMFVSLVVDVKLMPWDSKFLNRLNAAGLIAVVITLYCGQFFFLTSELSVTIILTAIVLAVNILFWLIWVVAFLRKSLTDFVVNNPHLAICRSLQNLKVPIIERRSFTTGVLVSPKKGSALSLNTTSSSGSSPFVSQRQEQVLVTEIPFDDIRRIPLDDVMLSRHRGSVGSTHSLWEVEASTERIENDSTATPVSALRQQDFSSPKEGGSDRGVMGNEVSQEQRYASGI